MFVCQVKPAVGGPEAAGTVACWQHAKVGGRKVAVVAGGCRRWQALAVYIGGMGHTRRQAYVYGGGKVWLAQNFLVVLYGCPCNSRSPSFLNKPRRWQKEPSFLLLQCVQCKSPLCRHVCFEACNEALQVHVCVKGKWFRVR